MITDYRALRGPMWNEADNPLRDEVAAYRDALERIAAILGEDDSPTPPRRASELTDNDIDQVRDLAGVRHLY